MTCDEYLQDPEAHSDHLASCASCRALSNDLDAGIQIEARPMTIDALPMAPWEGASHRTWPLVAAGLLSLVVMAMVLFIAAGTSPLQGIARALVSAVPSLDLLLNLSELAGGALHNAPAAWHIVIGLSFLAINTVLVLLLRRSPRGIDV